LHQCGEFSRRALTAFIGKNQLFDLLDAFARDAGASLEYASDEKSYRRIPPHGLVGRFRSGTQLINAAATELATQADSLMAAKSKGLA